MSLCSVTSSSRENPTREEPNHGQMLSCGPVHKMKSVGACSVSVPCAGAIQYEVCGLTVVQLFGTPHDLELHPTPGKTGATIGANDELCNTGRRSLLVDGKLKITSPVNQDLTQTDAQFCMEDFRATERQKLGLKCHDQTGQPEYQNHQTFKTDILAPKDLLKYLNQSCTAKATIATNNHLNDMPILDEFLVDKPIQREDLGVSSTESPVYQRTVVLDKMYRDCKRDQSTPSDGLAITALPDAKDPSQNLTQARQTSPALSSRHEPQIKPKMVGLNEPLSFDTAPNSPFSSQEPLAHRNIHTQVVFPKRKFDSSNNCGGDERPDKLLKQDHTHAEDFKSRDTHAVDFKSRDTHAVDFKSRDTNAEDFTSCLSSNTNNNHGNELEEKGPIPERCDASDPLDGSINSPSTFNSQGYVCDDMCTPIVLSASDRVYNVSAAPYGEISSPPMNVLNGTLSLKPDLCTGNTQSPDITSNGQHRKGSDTLHMSSESELSEDPLAYCQSRGGQYAHERCEETLPRSINVHGPVGLLRMPPDRAVESFLMDVGGSPLEPSLLELSPYGQSPRSDNKTAASSIEKEADDFLSSILNSFGCSTNQGACNNSVPPCGSIDSLHTGIGHPRGLGVSPEISTIDCKLSDRHDETIAGPGPYIKLDTHPGTSAHKEARTFNLKAAPGMFTSAGQIDSSWVPLPVVPAQLDEENNTDVSYNKNPDGSFLHTMPFHDETGALSSYKSPICANLDNVGGCTAPFDSLMNVNFLNPFSNSTSTPQTICHSAQCKSTDCFCIDHLIDSEDYTVAPVSFQDISSPGELNVVESGNHHAFFTERVSNQAEMTFSNECKPQYSIEGTSKEVSEILDLLPIPTNFFKENEDEEEEESEGESEEGGKEKNRVATAHLKDRPLEANDAIIEHPPNKTLVQSSQPVLRPDLSALRRRELLHECSQKQAPLYVCRSLPPGATRPLTRAEEDAIKEATNDTEDDEAPLRQMPALFTARTIVKVETESHPVRRCRGGDIPILNNVPDSHKQQGNAQHGVQACSNKVLVKQPKARRRNRASKSSACVISMLKHEDTGDDSSHLNLRTHAKTKHNVMNDIAHTSEESDTTKTGRPPKLTKIRRKGRTVGNAKQSSAIPQLNCESVCAHMQEEMIAANVFLQQLHSVSPGFLRNASQRSAGALDTPVPSMSNVNAKTPSPPSEPKGRGKKRSAAAMKRKSHKMAKGDNFDLGITYNADSNNNNNNNNNSSANSNNNSSNRNNNSSNNNKKNNDDQRDGPETKTAAKYASYTTFLDSQKLSHRYIRITSAPILPLPFACKHAYMNANTIKSCNKLNNDENNDTKTTCSIRTLRHCVKALASGQLHFWLRKDESSLKNHLQYGVNDMQGIILDVTITPFEAVISLACFVKRENCGYNVYRHKSTVEIFQLQNNTVTKTDTKENQTNLHARYAIIRCYIELQDNISCFNINPQTTRTEQAFDTSKDGCGFNISNCGCMDITVDGNNNNNGDTDGDRTESPGAGCTYNNPNMSVDNCDHGGNSRINNNDVCTDLKTYNDHNSKDQDICGIIGDYHGDNDYRTDNSYKNYDFGVVHIDGNNNSTEKDPVDEVKKRNAPDSVGKDGTPPGTVAGQSPMSTSRRELWRPDDTLSQELPRIGRNMENFNAARRRLKEINSRLTKSYGKQKYQAPKTVLPLFPKPADSDGMLRVSHRLRSSEDAFLTKNPADSFPFVKTGGGLKSRVQESTKRVQFPTKNVRSKVKVGESPRQHGKSLDGSKYRESPSKLARSRSGGTESPTCGSVPHSKTTENHVKAPNDKACASPSKRENRSSGDRPMLTEQPRQSLLSREKEEPTRVPVDPSLVRFVERLSSGYGEQLAKGTANNDARLDELCSRYMEAAGARRRLENSLGDYNRGDIAVALEPGSDKEKPGLRQRKGLNRGESRGSSLPGYVSRNGPVNVGDSRFTGMGICDVMKAQDSNDNMGKSGMGVRRAGSKQSFESFLLPKASGSGTLKRDADTKRSTSSTAGMSRSGSVSQGKGGTASGDKLASASASLTSRQTSRVKSACQLRPDIKDCVERLSSRESSPLMRLHYDISKWEASYGKCFGLGTPSAAGGLSITRKRPKAIKAASSTDSVAATFTGKRGPPGSLARAPRSNRLGVSRSVEESSTLGGGGHTQAHPVGSVEAAATDNTPGSRREKIDTFFGSLLSLIDEKEQQKKQEVRPSIDSLTTETAAGPGATSIKDDSRAGSSRVGSSYRRMLDNVRAKRSSGTVELDENFDIPPLSHFTEMAESPETLLNLPRLASARRGKQDNGDAISKTIPASSVKRLSDGDSLESKSVNTPEKAEMSSLHEPSQRIQNWVNGSSTGISEKSLRTSYVNGAILPVALPPGFGPDFLENTMSPTVDGGGKDSDKTDGAKVEASGITHVPDLEEIKALQSSPAALAFMLYPKAVSVGDALTNKRSPHKVKDCSLKTTFYESSVAPDAPLYIGDRSGSHTTLTQDYPDWTEQEESKGGEIKNASKVLLSGTSGSPSSQNTGSVKEDIKGHGQGADNFWKRYNWNEEPLSGAVTSSDPSLDNKGYTRAKHDGYNRLPVKDDDENNLEYNNPRPERSDNNLPGEMLEDKPEMLPDTPTPGRVGSTRAAPAEDQSHSPTRQFEVEPLEQLKLRAEQDFEAIYTRRPNQAPTATSTQPSQWQMYGAGGYGSVDETSATSAAFNSTGGHDSYTTTSHLGYLSPKMTPTDFDTTGDAPSTPARPSCGSGKSQDDDNLPFNTVHRPNESKFPIPDSSVDPEGYDTFLASEVGASTLASSLRGDSQTMGGHSGSYDNYDSHSAPDIPWGQFMAQPPPQAYSPVQAPAVSTWESLRRGLGYSYLTPIQEESEEDQS